MTHQITIRLPDDQVDFLDREVAAGHVASRAAGVARALRREQRRARAELDFLTLQTAGRDAELDEIVDWGTGHQAFPEEK